MLYGIRLSKLEDGKYVTTCRDLPECTYTSADLAEAMVDATKGITATIELFYRQKRKAIPLPTALEDDEIAVNIPLKLQAKMLLWNAVVARGLTLTTFAKEIGVSPTQAQRLVDFSKNASLEKIEQALQMLDLQFTLSVSRSPEK